MIIKVTFPNIQIFVESISCKSIGEFAYDVQYRRDKYVSFGDIIYNLENAISFEEVDVVPKNKKSANF